MAGDVGMGPFAVQDCFRDKSEPIGSRKREQPQQDAIKDDEIALVPPIPSANAKTAVKENRGAFHKVRMA